MFQNEGPVRRCRGRPQIRPDDETRRLVIEAAAREFQEKGYAGTGMSAVAQRAGVSTKTLYRLVPAKHDLFGLVLTDRIGRFILEIDIDPLCDLDPVVSLERILLAFGTFVLNDETIAINRLVISECDRFPEIATSFYQRAVGPTNATISAWLQRQSDRGLISLDDPDVAAGLLRGMMSQELQRGVLLGQRPVPDAAEIAARAKTCARLFLDGCRV
jgi:AcrR family transcriptional regulator